MRVATAALLLWLLNGCAMITGHVVDATPLDRGRLPAADVAVKIPMLRPCTDGADDTLHLSSRHPVTVLVHGCRGSAGHFRALAQLFAFHGQQAVCFNYDAGDSLLHSSRQLIHGLDEMSGALPGQHIAVIGHSMGGLVARKALEASRRGDWKREVSVRLATVSAPFGGIRKADPCTYKALQWASLGIVPALCWAITGDNWSEITSSSPFIREPGPLLPSVSQFVKVVTDERDSCRGRDASGGCAESDYVFTLAEQYQRSIDAQPGTTNVEVQAGHVEIVGYRDVVPRKLLAILQEQRLLAHTPPERRQALERLLAELY